MGNLLSFFRFGFYPIPHTIHSNNTKRTHTNTHSLTHTHTHAHTYNNKQSNADASCAASSKSLLSLAKRTTTITSKQRRRQQQLRCSTQKKFLFRCERVSVADFASFLSCICICCILLFLLLLCTIYSTPCSAIAHILLLMTFSPFCRNIKTPSPVAA